MLTRMMALRVRGAGWRHRSLGRHLVLVGQLILISTRPRLSHGLT
jgi:hypothetical protein